MSKKVETVPVEIINLESSEDEETSDSGRPLVKSRSVNFATTLTSPLTKPNPLSLLKSQQKPSTEIDTAPKKITNRRKSVHQSIRCTENLSFDACPVPCKRRDSTEGFLDEKQIKAKQRTIEIENEIDDAVDKNFQDPDMEKILKKIAYCRVFTNYLLKSYNLLEIDFKLYSNLDLLNLDLNMRIETYKAIEKSRQRFIESRGKGQLEL